MKSEKSVYKKENRNMVEKEISSHDEIKHQIYLACFNSGFSAKEEYKGSDWRTDVFAFNDKNKYAFEVQITKQSLTKTLERQRKYLRDGILACWLFEKEPSKNESERLDLPLFKVYKNSDGIYVSLKKRKLLSIDNFINDFLNDKMKFCSIMKTTKKQKIEISFMKMNCWKCGAENHIYFANKGFYSACNAILDREEMLWNSDRKEYMPEIISCVNNYVNQGKKGNICLGKIEERYSNTVGHSYVSFGCKKCNSIFGDWFVHEAIIDSWYGNGIVEKMICEINMDIDLEINIPHWCHPGDGNFCE